MTPLAYSIISISLSVILFGIILYVGLKTDVLRESIPNLVVKNRPYSLGRFQLWIWTLVVCPVFILYWGDSQLIDLNTTAVVLLGLPAGVAVTSMVVSSSQAKDHDEDGHVDSMAETLNTKKSNKTNTSASLVAQRAENVAAATTKSVPADPTPAPVVLKMHHESKSFFIDLISDDKGQLSLARLQQLLFTVAFVVIYVSTFFSKEMGLLPVFGAQVFALMGISSGTYLVSKGMNK